MGTGVHGLMYIMVSSRPTVFLALELLLLSVILIGPLPSAILVTQSVQQHHAHPV